MGNSDKDRNGKGGKDVAANLMSRIKGYAAGAQGSGPQTPEEWIAWNAQQAKESSKAVSIRNRGAKVENLIGRSGISEALRSHTFSGYKVENEGQRTAISYAKSYAQCFGTGFASFIFSGTVGTGKTHLSAAIGNKLMRDGKSVILITVADLMLQVRACYEGGKSEAVVINELCRVDLLIIDDVGMQRGTKSEGVLLNQIINRRSSELKPTGITTNLNFIGLSSLLGSRIMDRLKMDGGLWVIFDWESYRAKVTSKNFKK
jgi:putative replication protein